MAHVKDLIVVVRHLASRGFAPATGGNFSLRIDDSSFYITRSGADKSHITEEDFLLCNLEGQPLQSDLTPSAETLIHSALYKNDNGVRSVLHTHSVAATTLSRHVQEKVAFSGYEMQKSIDGIQSHDSTLELPVIENTQNMLELNSYLSEQWNLFSNCPGFLLRGHGLYAWGNSLFEAQRHIEGFEFLLECELNNRLLEKRGSAS